MRYLKYINEKLSADEMNKIKYFCEEHLVYLLDKGFTVEVKTPPIKYSADRDSRFSLSSTFNPGRDYRIYEIVIKSPSVSKWNDIKDIFIPFMTIMVDEFRCQFKGVSFKGTSHYSFEASIWSVIQDSFSEEMKSVSGIGKDLNISQIKITLLDIEAENSSIIL